MDINDKGDAFDPLMEDDNASRGGDSLDSPDTTLDIFDEDDEDAINNMLTESDNLNTVCIPSKKAEKTKNSAPENASPQENETKQTRNMLGAEPIKPNTVSKNNSFNDINGSGYKHSSNSIYRLNNNTSMRSRAFVKDRNFNNSANNVNVRHNCNDDSNFVRGKAFDARTKIIQNQQRNGKQNFALNQRQESDFPQVSGPSSQRETYVTPERWVRIAPPTNPYLSVQQQPQQSYLNLPQLNQQHQQPQPWCVNSSSFGLGNNYVFNKNLQPTWDQPLEQQKPTGLHQLYKQQQQSQQQRQFNLLSNMGNSLNNACMAQFADTAGLNAYQGNLNANTTNLPNSIGQPKGQLLDLRTVPASLLAAVLNIFSNTQTMPTNAEQIALCTNTNAGVAQTVNANVISGSAAANFVDSGSANTSTAYLDGNDMRQLAFYTNTGNTQTGNVTANSGDCGNTIYANNLTANIQRNGIRQLAVCANTGLPQTINSNASIRCASEISGGAGNTNLADHFTTNLAGTYNNQPTISNRNSFENINFLNKMAPPESFATNNLSKRRTVAAVLGLSKEEIFGPPTLRILHMVRKLAEDQSKNCE